MATYKFELSEEHFDEFLKQWLNSVVDMNTSIANGEWSREDRQYSKKLVKAAKRLYNYITPPEDHYGDVK